MSVGHPKLDLSDKSFYKLTAIKFSHIKNNRSYWEFLCECGRRITTSATKVKNGRARSCGRCTRIKDIAGKKFGYVTAIRFVKISNDRACWLCRCDCGKEKIINSHSLRSNTSCGCRLNLSGTKSKRFIGYKEIGGQLWSHIKYSAKQRKISFKLDIKYAYNLYNKQNRKCALTGKKIVFAKCIRRGTERTASLDRINNNLGYIEGNVQWVHKIVNCMKMRLTMVEFKKWCKLVTDHDTKKAT